MSASFAKALDAARDAAAQQHYPQGALYMVATPIGNLADISLRALHVLQLADTVACEDTRHTQALLRAYGISKSGAQTLAVHQHNEAEAAQQIVQRLQAGERVAYVSDAGTPAISDPGARLAAAVIDANLRVLPLPGASSIITALSACGAVAPSDEASGFLFAGFLSSKAGMRQAAIAAFQSEPRSVVLLEAPHRIEALAKDLAILGSRQVTLARELTKQFEQIHTLPASEASTWLAADPQHARGEFVVVIHPAPVQASSGDGERVLKLLMAELPLKTAVKLAAEISGESKNLLYDKALAFKA